MFPPTIAAAIDAAKKFERERCARIADAHADTYKAALYVSVCQKVAEEIAADIRQGEHLNRRTCDGRYTVDAGALA